MADDGAPDFEAARFHGAIFRHGENLTLVPFL
jgi:hypothetical protein